MIFWSWDDRVVDLARDCPVDGQPQNQQPAIEPGDRRKRIGMKAIVYTQFGPPEVLQLQEVEKPTPKDNEVLIRNICDNRCERRPGHESFPRFNGFLKPRHPILGQELAGEIEAIGSDVTRFQTRRPGIWHRHVWRVCRIQMYA